MANYHTNDLAIAADAENMKKVLLNFAANLAANSEETGFDFHEVAGIESVKAIYEAIEGRLSGFYEFSFSGAPIDEEIPSNDSLGWESSTSSASGYASQVEAMKSFASRLQGSGASIAFEVLPSGRPLSDEASVELTQYGDRWVIRLMYSTGWEPNSRELNLFFLGLPEGEYGVAFLDADEYDDYETISVFSGVHHGRALLHDVAEEGEDGSIDSRELWELQEEALIENKDEIDDLARLAFSCTVSWWNDGELWREYCEDDEEDYEDEGDYDDGESTDLSRFFLYSPRNWDNPDEEDLAEIDEQIIEMLPLFPIERKATGQGLFGRGQNVEYCVPGSEVRLKSDWDTSRFRYVEVDILDKEGKSLGDVGTDYSAQDNGLVVIACLLPHIRATVVNMETRGSRGDWRKQAHFNVRLELEPIDLAAVLAEVHELLRLDPKRRSLSSVVSEED